MRIPGLFSFIHPEAEHGKKASFRPTVLAVLDGFGVAQDRSAPYYAASHPHFEEIERLFPFLSLQASGIAVGLPWGEEGNSEVGHSTIGSGKILYHYLPRIVVAIQDGSFFQNSAFKQAIETVKKNSSRLHLIGLFSSGSVHAYPDHLYALMRFAATEGVKEVYLHIFSDGRDSPTRESAAFLGQLEARIQGNYPHIKIASLIGRSFAMNRDGDWGVVEKAYRLLTAGVGNPFKTTEEYVMSEHALGRTDEFIEPGFLVEEGGAAVGRIHAGDAVIFFNFREDSARELTHAFVDEVFDKFPREKISPLTFVSMTEYEKNLPALVAFPPLEIAWPIARVVAEAGLRQLHVAETEKYAHATYFFNGGREEAFPNEERILVPSLAGASLIAHPEMSADKITEVVLENLSKYDFIMVNFANADMMGHTGNYQATKAAIETLDVSIGKLMEKILEMGGALIITADHGNAEEKRYAKTGETRTKHTANPVPLFLIANEFKLSSPRKEEQIAKLYQNVGGVLTDVAPTILELMGLSIPADMIGVSVLQKLSAQKKASGS